MSLSPLETALAVLIPANTLVVAIAAKYNYSSPAIGDSVKACLSVLDLSRF